MQKALTSATSIKQTQVHHMSLDGAIHVPLNALCLENQRVMTSLQFVTLSISNT